jgi:purine-binding chemotaxis protein CheW
MTRASLCSFVLRDLMFGVPIGVVQEVLTGLPLTPMPLAPPAVAGLINLRGQVVTAIDLRVCLGFPRRDANAPFANLVLREGGVNVSFLVDAIGDVVEADDATFEPPPSTLDAATRELIRGAYRLPDRLLLALDTATLLDRALEGRS